MLAHFQVFLSFEAAPASSSTQASGESKVPREMKLLRVICDHSATSSGFCSSCARCLASESLQQQRQVLSALPLQGRARQPRRLGQKRRRARDQYAA